MGVVSGEEFKILFKITIKVSSLDSVAILNLFQRLRKLFTSQDLPSTETSGDTTYRQSTTVFYSHMLRIVSTEQTQQSLGFQLKQDEEGM